MYRPINAQLKMTDARPPVAKVFIQGKSFNSITASVFRSQPQYEVVNNLADSDMVVWTGGEDIWPGLYGEEPMSGTYWSKRDISDVDAIEQAVKTEKFMVGICRGAQLLNVIPNKGRLWQDVDGHNGGHHRAFDCVSGNWIIVNSVHHQMVRLTPEAEILCWAAESVHRRAQNESWSRPKDWKADNGIVLEQDKDIEAAWYPKTRSFLFQGHPEFGHPPTTKYFFGLLNKLYFGQ